MHFLIRTGRFLHRLFDAAAVVIIAVMLLYGFYSIWDIWKIYDQAGVSEDLLRYKPDGEDPGATFEELLAINPDVCAWITVDDTGIDYPVVQGDNNMFYLNHDVYGEYALSGSIFLDYRNNRDFTDQYSLLYGHFMDGGKMFGNLDLYKDKSYFESHKSGTLYLPDQVFQIRVFAFLETDAYDDILFIPDGTAEEDTDRFLEHIQENAVWYSGEDFEEDKNILGLATCDFEKTDGRYIVLANIVEETNEEK